MNFNKTSEHQELYLSDSIANIDSMIGILERQLVIQGKTEVNPAEPSDEEKTAKENLEAAIETQKANKTTLTNKLNDINIVKRAQNYELTVPIVEEEYTGGAIPIKDLFFSVGKLNDENKANCSDFFRKLFAYGKAQKFHDPQYKEALMALLEGGLLDDFVSMEDDDMQTITDFFLCVYHKKERLDDLEVKLDRFERQADEPIEASMKRYFLLARKVDSLYPEEYRSLCSEQQKIKTLLSMLQGTAKVELAKLRKAKLERGEHMTFDRLFENAVTLERIHNDVPKLPISMSTTSLNIHSAEVNGPIRQTFTKSPVEPYKIPAAQNAGNPYSALQKSVSFSKLPNSRSNSREDRPARNFSRSPIMSRSNSETRDRLRSESREKMRNRQKMARGQQVDRARSSESQNYSQRPKSAERPYIHRHTTPPSPQNYDRYPNNKNNNYGYKNNRYDAPARKNDFNRHYNQKGQKGKNNFPTCLLCGGLRQQPFPLKFTNTHSSTNCPNYINYNKNGCYRCRKYNIDAYHEPEECKLMSNSVPRQ